MLQKKSNRRVGGRENPKKPSKKPQKASEPPVTRLLAKRSMMRGQLGRLPPLSEAAATVRSRGPTGRASIRAADDVLEADLQSDEILACFEEALGERQPEMGTDAAAGREANAESAEAAPRLEAAAEQQREHSLLAPTAGRGVEPVLPDPVPMLHTYEFRWRAQIVRARCRRRSADRVGSCEHSRAARRGGASEGAR